MTYTHIHKEIKHLDYSFRISSVTVVSISVRFTYSFASNTGSAIFSIIIIIAYSFNFPYILIWVFFFVFYLNLMHSVGGDRLLDYNGFFFFNKCMFLPNGDSKLTLNFLSSNLFVLFLFLLWLNPCNYIFWHHLSFKCLWFIIYSDFLVCFIY